MTIIEKIQRAQVEAGEGVVIENLERMGLGTLWAIQLQGVDDAIPAPSHAEALAARVLLNADFSRRSSPGCLAGNAEIVLWPHGAHKHRSDMHLFRKLLVL